MQPSDFPLSETLDRLYAQVPGLGCQGCDGHCCVSPTMTAPEFVWMILGAFASRPREEWQYQVSAPGREHFTYAGNAHCRWQLAGGLCGNYVHRALSCRLHGHDALRALASDNTESCDLHPAGYLALSTNLLGKLLAEVTQINEDAGLPYGEPYYMQSLNLECWLDFMQHPSYCQDRESLQPLRTYLDRYLGHLPWPKPIPTHTTLNAKLGEIDKLYMAIAQGDGASVLRHLDSLENDYPSCATFWVTEARHFRKMLLEAIEPGAPESTETHDLQPPV